MVFVDWLVLGCGFFCGGRLVVLVFFLKKPFLSLSQRSILKQPPGVVDQKHVDKLVLLDSPPSCSTEYDL